MTNSTPSSRADRSHKQTDDEPENNELRKKLLEMIKRQETTRREKPR
jgi:hypothetical protein